MRVDLTFDGEPFTSVTLIDGGGVLDGDAPEWVRRLAVVEPGDPPVQVSPQEGERYLRALPAALAGTRTRAVLIKGWRPLYKPLGSPR